MPHEGQVELLLQVAIEVIGGHQRLERCQDGLVEGASFGRTEHGGGWLSSSSIRFSLPAILADPFSTGWADYGNRRRSLPASFRESSVRNNADVQRFYEPFLRNLSAEVPGPG